MKSEKEILEKAKELCNREDAECALFISGFIAGYKECLKDYGQNIEENK